MPSPEASPAEDKDVIQRQVLRGDLTIEQALKSGALSREEIEGFQRRYLLSSEPRPWEAPINSVWNALMRRTVTRVFVVPILFVFVGVTVTATFAEGAGAIAREYREWRNPPPPLEFTADELDVCDEWVLLLGVFSDGRAAQLEKVALTETLKDMAEDSLSDDVKVARDAEVGGAFLVLLDPLHGPSTRASVDQWLDSVHRVAPEWLHNRLLSARAQFYDTAAFTRTYGPLRPEAVRCFD